MIKTIKIQQSIANRKWIPDKNGYLCIVYGIYQIQELLYNANIRILSCKEYGKGILPCYRLKLELTSEQLPLLQQALIEITKTFCYAILKGV